MRKLVYTAFIAAVVLSLGCAITNYPVIFDTAGPDADQVLDHGYEMAYIKPDGDVALIYDDGSDNLYTLVSQTWEGDQWLKTYNNFDASASIFFLDQTYCDPNRQTDCAVWVAWNPDLPDNYPHGASSGSGNVTDDPFDGTFNEDCSGARSLSLLVSMTSRIGECGSGLWADKQALAFEFANLDTVTFRGREVYELPVDSSVASFEVVGEDGASTQAPIYGRFVGYVDNQFRVAVPVTPNAKYQLRWAKNWVENHGNFAEINVTYGSLNANFKVKVTTFDGALDRF